MAEDGRWTDIGPADGPEPGDSVVTGDVVCPALVDLHVHVGRGTSPFSVDPEVLSRTAVRVACSQGDAGYRNFAEWRDSTEDPSDQLRCVIALNVAPWGEQAGASGLESVDAGTAERVILLAREQPGSVRMIGVNLSRRALGGASARETLAVALQCRDETGLPLMIGLAEEEILPIAEQVDQLVAGDVITYCYRSRPWCLFPADGTSTTIERALGRGVLLDTGHGVSSFDADVARRALERGCRPHTISSDLQVSTAFGQDRTSLLEVAKKLVDCGLGLTDALSAMTHRPAQVLGLDDGTGSLRLGGRAELTVITLGDSRWMARAIAI